MDKQLCELYRKYQVKAESLDDFLDRYYKPDRYKGRDGEIWGENYSKLIRQSNQEYLDNYGVTWISRHESITGKTVSYYKP